MKNRLREKFHLIVTSLHFLFGLVLRIDESLEAFFFFHSFIYFALFENEMLVVVLFILLISTCSISTESRLYGPGLRASFQVPVRYFYLQTYDSNEQKYKIFCFDFCISTKNND
jgi:hypothetical protein